VRDGLGIARRCADLLAAQGEGMGLPAELGRVAGQLRAVGDALHGALEAALIDDPPHLRRDGGFVRQGNRPELDEARRLKEDSRGVMAGLEAKYVAQTGIKTLKVRHNNILGFYIEVTQSNAKPLLEEPLSRQFRHRQAMANAVRFSTSDLVEIEGRIAQVHGGIGWTDEQNLHFWFKRIAVARHLLGGPEMLRARAASLQDLAA
jgi:DNA mismatch repair protein MutS